MELTGDSTVKKHIPNSFGMARIEGAWISYGIDWNPFFVNVLKLQERFGVVLRVEFQPHVSLTY